MRKLILKNWQSPGDTVMLTAAVRDLHQNYPGRFLTDVRTPSPGIWLHNPYITPIADDDPEAELIECHYPLIHQSNQLPNHFVVAFSEYLGDQLGLRIKSTGFKGDIHFSPEELAEMEAMEAHDPSRRPLWLVTAGGKNDYTIKWWSNERYQQVVEHFQGRIDFVQVGEAHHHHPPLRGAIDLRGQTDIRQLIRLMYQADGALSSISLLMHLSAAVPTKPGRRKNRACVVVAGGREPVQWAAYPHHQFIHTLGALACCDNGGCWKSRTVPLGDGDEKDNPDQLCCQVVENLPKCMHMITADEVIRRIEWYYA